MKKTTSKLFVVPYMLWIALFVLAPLVLIFGQSFFNIEGQFSLENYKSYFASQNLTYLKMSFNSALCGDCDHGDATHQAIQQPSF